MFYKRIFGETIESYPLPPDKVVLEYLQPRYYVISLKTFVPPGQSFQRKYFTLTGWVIFYYETYTPAVKIS